jgi:two-component system, LytTR family, response regulator
MNPKLRVVIADDERPARLFLAATLRSFKDVELVGEAVNGADAVKMIERERPDMAFLDLQMPELDGMGVVRLLKKNRTPLIAFVTAYDQYAVRAFELNAVDYLLKPVEPSRVRETIDRAQERLEQIEFRAQHTERVRAAIDEYDNTISPVPLERIPVRRRDEILLVSISEIASVVAEGELLHIRTNQNDKHTICHRLRDLEARMNSRKFVRLGRGTIVNVDMIQRIVPLPGGTYTVVLKNNQEFKVSRIQSRIIREQLLRL